MIGKAAVSLNKDPISSITLEFNFIISVAMKTLELTRAKLKWLKTVGVTT
ncbi:MAG: hypothetical protein ACFFD8_06630 [Candidatus Thorarchaeota archaeon]